MNNGGAGTVFDPKFGGIFLTGKDLQGKVPSKIQISHTFFSCEDFNLQILIRGLKPNGKPFIRFIYEVIDSFIIEKRHILIKKNRITLKKL